METKDQKIKRLNEHLNSISPEVLLAKYKEQAARDENNFQNLKEALAQDKCDFCGYSLSHFSISKPCFHWLLWKARGLRKKYFSILFEQKSFHELEAYLRWVANCDAPIRNINDLVKEKSSTKFIETTIKYKNIEWSFSCSHGDLQGHKDKHEGVVPHYHFQMKINGNVVINYNGFHIPFNDYDEFCFAMEGGEFDRLKAIRVQGAGMQAISKNLNSEELIDDIRKSEIKMDEGTTIPGDEIFNILEESKKTSIPMSKLIQKLTNIKTRTFISPGHGAPKIATRNKNRGNKI